MKRQWTMVRGPAVDSIGIGDAEQFDRRQAEYIVDTPPLVADEFDHFKS